MKKILLMLMLMLVCNIAKAEQFDYEKYMYMNVYSKYVINNESADFSFGTRNLDKKIYKKFKKKGYIDNVTFGKEIDEEDEKVLIVNIKGFKNNMYVQECAERKAQIERILK